MSFTFDSLYKFSIPDLFIIMNKLNHDKLYKRKINEKIQKNKVL